MQNIKEAVSKREKEILRAVVESHVADAAPVGSRTLSRSRQADLELSPATIRNVMADLEERGFIMQPHTSAGRVPTDKGYRFFVDELMRTKALGKRNRQIIDDSLLAELAHSSAIDDIKETVLGLLSRLSKNAGLMLYPRISASSINRFHFIKISDFNVQVILITEKGLVQNLFLELDQNFSEDELLELTNFVNAEYAGNTLKQICKNLRHKLKSEKARIEKLRIRALLIQEKLLSQQERVDVIIEGAATFLDAPEFKNNAEKLKNLFKTLSDKEKLLKIVAKCLDSGHMSINIGSEMSTAGLEDCSFLVYPYGRNTEREGTIGIVGPRRMDYSYICGLLEYVSIALNRVTLDT